MGSDVRAADVERTPGIVGGATSWVSGTAASAGPAGAGSAGAGAAGAGAAGAGAAGAGSSLAHV